MTADHDMAVDPEGRPLPMTPAEVRATIVKLIDTGELIAVIVRDRTTEDIAMQVLGPPSRAVLDTLETAVRAYRRVLNGHG